MTFRNAGFEQWGHLKEVALMNKEYYSLIIMGIKTSHGCLAA
jgi:hypothetical protein